METDIKAPVTQVPHSSSNSQEDDLARLLSEVLLVLTNTTALEADRGPPAATLAREVSSLQSISLVSHIKKSFEKCRH